jgi:hypothetical protein
MNDVYATADIKDRGGRRLGIDRRSFSIPSYCLEARSGQDRRSGLDRRSAKDDFLISFNPKRRTDRYAYEFYVVNNRYEEPDLIAILPERRKNRRRITQKSIMKWGQLAAGGYGDPINIHFIRITLEPRE